jgi:predicted DNA-binding ribbon-helix-helix protein
VKSSVVKHSVSVGRHRTSVSLENEFWSALKEIAAHRKMSLAALIRNIQANQQHGNLCSAIRLFVIGFYRDQSATDIALEDKAQETEAGRELDRPLA